MCTPRGPLGPKPGIQPVPFDLRAKKTPLKISSEYLAACLTLAIANVNPGKPSEEGPRYSDTIPSELEGPRYSDTIPSELEGPRYSKALSCMIGDPSFNGHVPSELAGPRYPISV